MHLPPHQHLPLYPASAIPSRSVRLLPRLYFPFPRDFSLPSAASGRLSLPLPPNFLLAFPCFTLSLLPSVLTNVQLFNVAMQDRYGLLTS